MNSIKRRVGATSIEIDRQLTQVLSPACLLYILGT